MKKYLFLIFGLILANIAMAQRAPGSYMRDAARERNERNERQAREDKAKQQSTVRSTPEKKVDSYTPQTTKQVKHEETEDEKQLREEQEKKTAAEKKQKALAGTERVLEPCPQCFDW